MNGQNQPSFRQRVRPYLFIGFIGLLAFAPVSFMLQGLKNDILALEYPINYFISQTIREGEIPYWFNTWGLGFPLQSNLTWGIFSLPQLLFCTFFEYNIWILHLEFIFFILLSGWSMFHLLKKFFLTDQRIAEMLAICYMLSGFMVGSSQWLLYLTAAAFVPLVISALLELLYRPRVFQAIRFAVIYLLMFTSVYAAFNIITTYALVIFVIIYLIKDKKDKQARNILYKNLIVAGLVTAMLCAPVLYFTIELLQNMDRGDGISTDSAFFHSNYLHPGALSSMLLPLSSTRMGYANTEGTMLHSYMGIFVLLVLAPALMAAVKFRNKKAWWMLGAVIIFLLAAFGNLTPVRGLLNILPGFSYFRNPAIFRFFFILSVILFLAIVLKQSSWSLIFSARSIRPVFMVLVAVCSIVLLIHIGDAKNIWKGSLMASIQQINYAETLVVSAVIQLLLLLVLMALVIKQRTGWALWVLAADLVINTFICTPYFTVSSYSLTEVNTILASTPRQLVQEEKINQVPARFTDNKMNTWENVNVYQKKVSSNPSYRGPLVLKNYSIHTQDSSKASELFNHRVAAVGDSSSGTISGIVQRPNMVLLSVVMEDSGTVTLFQNYYKGWHAMVDKQFVPFVDKEKPGLHIKVPAGKSHVAFRYMRMDVANAAVLLHLFVIVFFCIAGLRLIKIKTKR